VYVVIQRPTRLGEIEDVSGARPNTLQFWSRALVAELDNIAKKLGNPQFLAKAKPEVIEEQRERAAEEQAALARVRAALARIGAG
jgi:valyl-tRNA synthetase